MRSKILIRKREVQTPLRIRRRRSGDNGSSGNRVGECGLDSSDTG
jgi:hypothetical protein